ncbi:MAG: hypothetical protein J6V01_05055, partial [Clostridia bacterium]|nr:hypothetical protein [Clostridia bacterium]
AEPKTAADLPELAAAAAVADPTAVAFTHADTDYEGEELIRVFRIAKDCGCLFTFGTDTHSLKGLDDIRRADRISELIGITEDDLAPYVRG